MLPTKVVDDFLYPEVATTSLLYKNKMKMKIVNGGHFSNNLGHEIVWQELDKKHITPKEVILKSLNDE